MARKDEKPIDKSGALSETPAVDPLFAPLPASLVDAGPTPPEQPSLAREILREAADPESITARYLATLSQPKDQGQPAALALVKVRIAEPGVVARGSYQAGRDYEVDAATAEQLLGRGFIKVED